MNVELHRPKTWCLPDIDESSVVSLAEQLGVPVPVASVYLVRGLKKPMSSLQLAPVSFTIRICCPIWNLLSRGSLRPSETRTES